jgi:hypothetical protein
VEKTTDLLKVIPLNNFEKSGFPTGKIIFSHPVVEK